MKLVASFACGVIFALGLGIAGMTRADTVLAFLNLAGTWDPTLAFVMVGAIGAHRLLYGWITGREAPVLEDSFHLPSAEGVDRPLLGGGRPVWPGLGALRLLSGPGGGVGGFRLPGSHLLCGGDVGRGGPLQGHGQGNGDRRLTCQGTTTPAWSTTPL